MLHYDLRVDFWVDSLLLIYDLAVCKYCINLAMDPILVCLPHQDRAISHLTSRLVRQHSIVGSLEL